MYPILFSIGKFSVYTYGFFIAMGFIVGITLAKREAVRVGESPEKIMDLTFYILIAAIVGARLFYVTTDLKVFLSDPLEIVKIWKGGLVFYGGFIAALAVAVIFMKRHAMPVWQTTDIMAPSLAIGHCLGRIGCFFAGCCYGKECDLPWAVTFHHPKTLAPVGIPLHPTQLYSALNNLIIFGLLWTFRRHKTFDGQVFWIYVLLYGISRSIIEMFRADFRGASVLGVLSISQTISVMLAILSLVMMVYLRKQALADPDKKNG